MRAGFGHPSSPRGRPVTPVMAHSHLGVALARQGRLAEARQQCAEVLRLDPDYAGARRLLSAIQP